MTQDTVYLQILEAYVWQHFTFSFVCINHETSRKINIHVNDKNMFFTIFFFEAE